MKSQAMNSTAQVIQIDRQNNNMTAEENNLEGLPEPLTPEGCDLSNFPYFSFDAAKFRDSDFALTVDPAAGFRAVMLWSAAWHQKPAASLPNNDKVLFRLSGCMSMDEWLSIKEEALYGFVLCSDGRLYHKYLAEHARKAFSKSRKAKAAVASRKDRQPDPVQKPNGRKANVEQTFNDDSTNVPTNVVLGEERRGEGEESNNPLNPPLEGEEEKSDFDPESIDIEKFDEPVVFQGEWIADPRMREAFESVFEKYEVAPTELLWELISEGFIDHWTNLNSRTAKAKRVAWVSTFRNHVRAKADSRAWSWKKEQEASGTSAPQYIHDAFDQIWESMPLVKIGEKPARLEFIEYCKGKPEANVRRGVEIILEDLAEKFEFIGGRDSPLRKTYLCKYIRDQGWRDESMPLVFEKGAQS